MANFDIGFVETSGAATWFSCNG